MNPLNLPNRYSLVPVSPSEKSKFRKVTYSAEELVTKVTNAALWLVENEKKRQFIYKFPKPRQIQNINNDKSKEEKSDKDNLEHETSSFNLKSASSQIDLFSHKETSQEKFMIVKDILSDIIPMTVSVSSLSDIPIALQTAQVNRSTMAEVIERIEDLDVSTKESDKEIEAPYEDLNKLPICGSSADTMESATYDSSKDSLVAEVSSNKSNSSNTLDDYNPNDVDWVKIKDFNLRTAISNLKEYIGTWRISKQTKWAVVETNRVERVTLLGVRYFVDVYFSKPIKYCPNPLAIAKVHFSFHVSFRMPRWFPIMVTYQFEGNKHLFYALGTYCIRSADFQRYYIDQIITEKTRFFSSLVRISDCLEQGKTYAVCKKLHKRTK